MLAWSGGADEDPKDSPKLVHFILQLLCLAAREKERNGEAEPKGPGELKEEEMLLSRHMSICTAKASGISRETVKSRCAREWGGWGQIVQ